MDETAVYREMIAMLRIGRSIAYRRPEDDALCLLPSTATPMPSHIAESAIPSEEAIAELESYIALNSDRSNRQNYTPSRAANPGR